MEEKAALATGGQRRLRLRPLVEKPCNFPGMLLGLIERRAT